MTTDQLPFKVLFCFENDNLVIIEIKRTDIQSEDKRLVYKWLLVQKQNEKQNKYRISILTFQSMESSEERQIRTFAEGILTWNMEEVIFNDEKLAPVDIQLIDQQYLMLISDSLLSG